MLLLEEIFDYSLLIFSLLSKIPLTYCSFYPLFVSPTIAFVACMFLVVRMRRLCRLYRLYRIYRATARVVPTFHVGVDGRRGLIMIFNVQDRS